MPFRARVFPPCLAILVAWAGPGLSAQSPATPSKAGILEAIHKDLPDHPDLAIGIIRHELSLQGSMSIENFSADPDWRTLLDLAHRGQAASQPGSPERVEFTRLAAMALGKAGKPGEAQLEMDKVAGLIDSLHESADPESRFQALNGLLSLGQSNLGIRRLPEAMDCFIKALRWFDEAKDPRGQAICYAYIARIHYESGRMDEAVKAHLKAIQISKDAGIEGTLSGLYLALGNTYARMDGKVGEEFLALQQAREAAIQEGNDFNLAVVMTNIADVALQQRNYRLALQYAEEALPLVEKNGDQISRAVCFANKGIAMNRMGNSAGIAWVEKAAGLFDTLPNDRNDQAEIRGSLADEYAFNHDWQKAYAAEADFKKRTDELRKESDQRRIAETEAAYHADLQRRQIEALQKQRKADGRIRMLWILAALMALCTALALVLSRRRLKQANLALEDMSLHDPLTGLPNRRYLAARVEEDLAQIRRLHRSADGSPVANSDVIFMMVDIDRFKEINDTYGHAGGDEVLRQLAKVLQGALRDSDTVVRWGGEEFLILAKHTNRGDAHLLAERIRAAVAEHHFRLADGSALRRTCSIGFACYPFLPAGTPSPSWEAVVSLADQCLYAAKSSGRDMWAGLLPAPGLQAAPPADLGAQRGAEEGFFELVHSEGRKLAWPS